MEEKKNKINKTKISVVLGIMCFALALGICIQIRTVKNSNSTVSSNYEENNLRAEVLKYKEKYDTIMFSAGKIGYQVEVSPDDLKRVIKYSYADVVC